LAAVIARLIADGEGSVHRRLIEIVERELFTRTLTHTHGHQANASELLGINRTTLRYKLKEFGIALDKVVTDRAEGE
jgi:two-component system nitrogen regulation response regulator GlnG